MEDQEEASIIPYHETHDEYGGPYMEKILNFANDVTPNINNNIVVDQDHNLQTSSQYPKNDSVVKMFEDQNGNQNIDDYLIDPYWQDLYTSNGGESCPQIPGDHQEGQQNLGTHNFGDGDHSMPQFSWPIPPFPFHCTFCQVLRQIIHVKDNATFKLEVHGRLGLICHAILQKRNVDPSVVIHDFCRKNIEEVKQFLLQYCIEKKYEGYIMLADPLTTFYETICVGLEWDDILNNIDDLFIPSSTNTGEENQMEQPQQNEQVAEDQRNQKYSLSEQRRRTGTFTKEALRKYLMKPIDKAAKELNLCSTVVKKICRRNGLPRWPYRKIMSTKKQIESLKLSLVSKDANIRKQAKAEIKRLREELKNNYCAGIDVFKKDKQIVSSNQAT